MWLLQAHPYYNEPKNWVLEYVLEVPGLDLSVGVIWKLLDLRNLLLSLALKLAEKLVS
jgi:hypothetical protein